MILIRGPTDVGRFTDLHLQRLLLERLTQLTQGEPYDPGTHGELFVVQPGDTSRDVEVSIHFPILTNAVDGSRYGESDFQPNCDVIEDHSSCYEMVFAVHDDFGFAVFVPKRPDIDAELLTLCAAFATRSD